MRRYLIAFGVFLSLVFIIAGIFFLRGTKHSPPPTLETINVLEDKRSLINLPVYLAMEKGYFEEFNVKFKLSTAKDGEFPMGILEEGKGYQLLLCGGEEMIYALQAEIQRYKYIYNLAQGSGTYLLSRTFSSDFNSKNLNRKLIIGAPRGSLREMILEYYLHANQLAPQRDVNIVQTLVSPNNSSVFLSNSGDFLLTEEPIAAMLSKKGLGVPQVDLSNITFPLLYKGLITTPELLNDNPSLLKGVTKALYKAQIIINYQPISEYLSIVKKYFPNYTNDELTTAISYYKKSNVWPTNPAPYAENFNNLTKLMSSAGELRKPLDAAEFLEASLVNSTLQEIKKEEIIPPSKK